MTIDNFDFNGHKALVRVDFNVPLDENGNITDDTRIRGALPTLKKILSDGGSAIIMSHMGKPKGKVNAKFSLGQIKDAVSKALTAMQKQMGQGGGIVMDGRDIGTAVFPDAELKIFVNASAETRAQRRFKEMVEKGIPATYQEVLANVAHRDHIDTTRAESPLRRADNAIALDNSAMTPEQQDAWLMVQFNKAAGL